MCTPRLKGLGVINLLDAAVYDVSNVVKFDKEGPMAPLFVP